MVEQTAYNFKHTVMQVDLLSEQEERDLVQKYQSTKNHAYANKLVMAYMKYVVKLAMAYTNSRIPEEDLIQEGSIGLMKALNNFDLDAGVRLSSYATPWIKSQMLEYVLTNRNVMKTITTKAQRKIYFNKWKYLDERGELSVDAKARMANDLNVSVEQIEETVDRMHINVASICYETNEEPSMTGMVQESSIPSPWETPEDSIINNDYTGRLKMVVSHGIGKLNDREKDIIHERWMNDTTTTLSDLSGKHKVSLERIRQVEKAAIKKLKTTIEQQYSHAA